MIDLQARLDAAITEQREVIWRGIAKLETADDPVGDVDDAIGRLVEALVAVRARISEQGYGNMLYGRMAELIAEAERLLEDA